MPALPKWISVALSYFFVREGPWSHNILPSSLHLYFDGTVNYWGWEPPCEAPLALALAFCSSILLYLSSTILLRPQRPCYGCVAKGTSYSLDALVPWANVLTLWGEVPSPLALAASASTFLLAASSNTLCYMYSLVIHVPSKNDICRVCFSTMLRSCDSLN